MPDVNDKAQDAVDAVKDAAQAEAQGLMSRLGAFVARHVYIDLGVIAGIVILLVALARF